MLFVYLGPNLSAANSAFQHDGKLLTYKIDPTTGLLGEQTGSNGSTNLGRSFGADPLGGALRLQARGNSGEFSASCRLREIKER
jgi:hypothetical protein